MPNRLVCEDSSVNVIVGVDTHKHEHVAVATMAWVLDSQQTGRRRIRPATRSCWPGLVSSARSKHSGSKAPAPTASASRASCVFR